MSSWTLPYIETVVWALTIAYSDLVRRRIPNVLALGGVVVALLVVAAEGTSAIGAASVSALAAGGLALGLTLPAYLVGSLGAGDVKLAVAIGLLSELEVVITTFVIGSLLAGAWAGIWLLCRYTPRFAIWLERHRWLGGGALGASATRRPVPFGAALAVGFTASIVLRTFGPTP